MPIDVRNVRLLCAHARWICARVQEDLLVRNALLISTIAVIVLAPSLGLAAWQPLTGTPISIASLDNESLVVGDKVFSNFDLFGFGAGGAIGPDPTVVFVQGGLDDLTGDYGLRFLLSWNAGSGQTINANINFQVAILDDPLWRDWYIKDTGLVLSGVSATASGVVNASETVWDGPIPDGNVLASLSTSKQAGDDGTQLLDWAQFDPVKTIWVRKDISITGGTAADGSAHLSEMFQFYSQVPEPGTIILITLGGAFVAMRRRRAARASG